MTKTYDELNQPKALIYDDNGEPFASKRKKRIVDIYHDCVVIANNKAHNLEPWNVLPSSYFINEILHNEFEEDYKESFIALFNFNVEGKIYVKKHAFFTNSSQNNTLSDDLEPLLKDYAKSFTHKGHFKYNSMLSKQLFDIFMDFLNDWVQEHSNLNKINKKNIVNRLNFEKFQFKTQDSDEVKPRFSARIKNFERDLLIYKYPNQLDDVDNKESKDLVFASSEVFYVSSSQYFYILTYTPTNDQYFNDKIKEHSKAPSISVNIYKKEVEDFFIEHFDEINLLHNNYIQFIYASDTNQNIANAMGEASLVSQHWYTKSIEKILNDHKTELKKDKTSRLLAEYIVRYILAAEIEGVNLVEIYPFDRVFIFDQPINFTDNVKKRELQYRVAEGLIESKIAHNKIHDKEFLGGKTRFAYEWERLDANIPMEKCNPSKKKLAFIENSTSRIGIDNDTSHNRWIEPYNKDIDTVINNMLYTFRTEKLPEDKINALLEYQSNYVNNNIVYLYSSSTSLTKQIPVVYELQKEYLKNLNKIENLGIDKIDYDALYEQNNDSNNSDKELFDFENAKIVLFSYCPEEEQKKGFTLLLIANQDVPKAVMEQKAERDDLHTVLKLLINQHFTIDYEYKKAAQKEQEELVAILEQTEHSIKNSFDEFLKDSKNFTKDNISLFKEKILHLLEQDKKQMKDYGQEGNIVEINFLQRTENPSAFSSTVHNSLTVLQMMLSANYQEILEEEKAVLNKKFDANATSREPWSYFANEIVKLAADHIIHRIHSIEWIEPETKKTLVLTIDFNELQDFSFEWKESLFNDAIYVMLKNACEHAYETIEKESDKREIFLDIYISFDGENDVLNIEFTNDTKQICEEQFNHINKGLQPKSNRFKTNSTGIGVVTLRKRLDVTYGLDKSDIRFSLVGPNKIKSRLYIPIKTLINKEKIFKSPHECQVNTNILYFEDEHDFFTPNIQWLKKNKFQCDHYMGFSSKIDFSQYSILLTDLNILGETGEHAAATNGHDVIDAFTRSNPDGVVLLLSSDTINEESVLNGYSIKEIKDLNENEILQPSTLYYTYEKTFSSLENLSTLLEKFLQTKENPTDHTNVKTLSQSIISTTPKLLQFDEIVPAEMILNNLSHENKKADDINAKVFFEKSSVPIRNLIEQWEACRIQRKHLSPLSISNCEVPEHFIAKLAIQVEKEKKLYWPAIAHELYRRNIILVSPDASKEGILQLANSSLRISTAKKGTLRQLNHDIFAKMKPFDRYTDSYIQDLQSRKNDLVEQCELQYNLFINEKENTKEELNAIEEIFQEFVDEMEKLYFAAIDQNETLGSTTAKLQHHLESLKYFLTIKDTIWS